MEITYGLNPNCIGKNGPESAYGWVQQTTSIDEFLKQTAEEGLAIMPGQLSNSYKCNENIQGFEILVVDVDNEQGETRWIDAINDSFLQQNAIAMWTSSNHQRVWQEGDDPKKQNSWKGQDRYRILFKLPEVLEIVDRRLDPKRHNESLKEVNQLLKRLQLMVPGSDQNCKAGTCLFGTDVPSTIHVFSEINVLDVTQLVALPEKVVHIHQSGEYTQFNGSVNDSLNNVKQFLSFISSDSESNWKDVGSALRNIEDSIGGEHVALDLYIEWSAKDYDPKPGESERMFLHWDSNPELGGWGKLKELALDGGYLPHAIEALEPITFEPIEGFKVTDSIQSAVDQEPTNEEITSAYIQATEQSSVAVIQLKFMIQQLYTNQGKIKFNELTQEIEVCGDPMKAYHFEDARLHLHEKLGILVSSGDAQAVLRNEANKNRYNPVSEYLELVAKDPTLEVDLDLVATRVLGVNDELSIAMVKAWLVGAVSKVMNPEGSKFIEVLTLISNQQGIGKSEFFKSLASPKWFSDSFAQTENEKDRLLVLHSAWINEISEVDQFANNKRDFKQMKGLVSATSDQMRVPYGRVMESKPRHFVLGASTNEEELYAGDDQQRRFWSIKVQPTTDCGRLDIQWLQDNRSAIWATATRLYQQFGDEAFKLTKEQKELLIDHNQQEFTRVSSYHDMLAHSLEKHDVKRISVNQTYNICYIDKLNQTLKNEIAGIMKSEGYTKKRNLTGADGRTYSSLWVNDKRTHDYLGKNILDF